MRKLLPLLAIAGAFFTAACSDTTSPGAPPQFSKQITFTNLQDALQGLPANGAARVKIELPPSGLIAREVKVKDPQEVNQQERVESRITDLVLNTAGDQGTLTLEPGFKVSFTKDTKFEANDTRLTFQQFVDRVNAALAQNPKVFLPVEAERSPADVLRPGDAFPAAKLELGDEVGGPELQINITSTNLVAVGSGDCQSSLSSTLQGCLEVLGLTIGIDATTELQAMLPGVVETKFDGIVDCQTLKITSPHEGSFSLVGQNTTIEIVSTTKIEFESGDDETVADLSAVKMACDANPPQTVRAEGEGVPGATAGTIEATELEFKVEDQVHAAEAEFTGTIEAINSPNLTVSGRTVVTNAATEIERADVKIALTDLHTGETVKVEGTLQGDGSVLAREIKAAAPAPAQEVEFTGTIGAIASPTLVVSGRTVVTDEHTEIERGDAKITLADLHVGDTVEVKGTLQSDGSVLAREIEVKS